MFPGFQVYEIAPAACKVADEPTQIGLLLAVMLNAGVALIGTATTVELLQPPIDPVTV